MSHAPVTCSDSPPSAKRAASSRRGAEPSRGRSRAGRALQLLQCEYFLHQRRLDPACLGARPQARVRWHSHSQWSNASFFCGLQIDRAGHWGASSLWACLLGKRGCLLALRHYFARDDENHGRMLSLYFTFRTGDPVVGWHLRRLCSCACCSGRSSRDARGHANGPRTSHSKISA
jgi:hypothetical protein